MCPSCSAHGLHLQVRTLSEVSIVVDYTCTYMDNFKKIAVHGIDHGGQQSNQHITRLFVGYDIFPGIVAKCSRSQECCNLARNNRCFHIHPAIVTDAAIQLQDLPLVKKSP